MDDARGGVPPLRRRGALRTEPPLRMSVAPSKFSSTRAEYVKLALRAMHVMQFRTVGSRTMLAGECPLCGAPISEWASRLEDGAPATHVRYAVEVQRRYSPSWRR